MRFNILLAAATIVMGVSAQGSGTCFDDGDCFTSGGHCVKESGSITGTCSSASTTSGSGSGGGSFPTGFPGGGGGGFPTGFPGGSGGGFPTGFPGGSGGGIPTGFRRMAREPAAAEPVQYM